MWQFLIHRRKGSLPIAVGNLALFSFRGKLSHCMFNLIDAIKVLRFAQVPKFFHPSHHCARRFPISLRRNAANYRGLLRTDATTGPIHYPLQYTHHSAKNGSNVASQKWCGGGGGFKQSHSSSFQPFCRVRDTCSA